MKQVTINLEFSKINSYTDIEVETMITKKLQEKNIIITKFRNTYVESKHGLADMPTNLFLALIISSRYYTEFSWYLYKLSGKYTFKFNQ